MTTLDNHQSGSSDEINELLLDLESHFAVPAITASEAHVKARTAIERICQQWEQQIRGITCPACGGHNTIFIGSGGYLTCSWINCNNPALDSAITAAIEAAKEGRDSNPYLNTSSVPDSGEDQ